LAPSPIASVTLLGYLFLIILTISAFCFGETRQAKTTSAESEHFKKISRKESTLSINVREAPATMIDYFRSVLFSIAGKICYKVLYKSLS
jgi:hypothetical protein